MTRVNSRVIATALSIVITLFSTLTPIYYGQKNREEDKNPIRSLQYLVSSPTDPLEDISNPNSGLSLSVKKDGTEVNNLRIVGTSLLYIGDSAISPEDMFEPLTISTDSTWKIIGIAGQYENTVGPKLHWQKISDTQYKSDPSLINSKDNIRVNVYLEWKGDQPPPKLGTDLVRWSAHIKNVKLEPYPPFQSSFHNPTLFAEVWDWGIAFIVIIFAIYQSTSLYFLSRIKYFKDKNAPFLLAIIPISAINMLGSAALTVLTLGVSSRYQGEINTFPSLIIVVTDISMIFFIAALSIRSDSNLLSSKIND